MILPSGINITEWISKDFQVFHDFNQVINTLAENVLSNLIWNYAYSELLGLYAWPGVDTENYPCWCFIYLVPDLYSCFKRVSKEYKRPDISLCFKILIPNNTTLCGPLGVLSTLFGRIKKIRVWEDNHRVLWLICPAKSKFGINLILLDNYFRTFRPLLVYNQEEGG